MYRCRIVSTTTPITIDIVVVVAVSIGVADNVVSVTSNVTGISGIGVIDSILVIVIV
jgi:hypothetical protein